MEAIEPVPIVDGANDMHLKLSTLLKSARSFAYPHPVAGWRVSPFVPVTERPRHRLNLSKSTVAISLLLMAVGGSYASANCDTHSLDGTYAFKVQGVNLGVFDAAGTLHLFASQPPFSGVGQYTFDGAGSFTRIDYNVSNGSASFASSPVNDEGFRTGVSGTYSVDQDCTGSISVNLGATQIELAISVIDYGDGAYAVLKSEHVGSYPAASLPSGTTCDSGCDIAVSFLGELKRNSYRRR